MKVLTENDAGITPDVASSHLRAAERVVAAMSEDGCSALSLRDMADIAYLSPYHFSRVFRRVTGASPGEFQAAVRLERAKRLLLTTDLSVVEVCFEVGYESLGSFTTRFTRLVGVSPGRMRRLAEEVEDAPDRPPVPPPGAPPVDAGVAVRVLGQEGPVHVGLFPGAIPQGCPVAGALVSAPGVHTIAPVPDGSYHLMAAALPRSRDPLQLLLPGDGLRVGRDGRPVVVRAGRAEGVAEVAMRPRQAADPPLLISLAGVALSGRSRRGKG